MSVTSIVIAVPYLFLEINSLSTEECSVGIWVIFKDWSSVTVALVFMGAATGFLVAFATKLTDAVTKTLAMSMGLLLTYATEVTQI